MVSIEYFQMLDFTRAICKQFLRISLINERISIPGHEDDSGVLPEMLYGLFNVQLFHIVLSFLVYVLFKLREHAGEEAINHEIRDDCWRMLFGNLLAEAFK